MGLSQLTGEYKQMSDGKQNPKSVSFCLHAFLLCHLANAPLARQCPFRPLESFVLF